MSPLTHMRPSLFRDLRIAAGVTQRTAAAFMEISAAALCQYERRGTGVGEWKIYRASDWLRGVEA